MQVLTEGSDTKSRKFDITGICYCIVCGKRSDMQVIGKKLAPTL
jgi:hypothetical protein